LRHSFLAPWGDKSNGEGAGEEDGCRAEAYGEKTGGAFETEPYREKSTETISSEAETGPEAEVEARAEGRSVAEKTGSAAAKTGTETRSEAVAGRSSSRRAGKEAARAPAAHPRSLGWRAGGKLARGG